MPTVGAVELQRGEGEVGESKEGTPWTMPGHCNAQAGFHRHPGPALGKFNDLHARSWARRSCWMSWVEDFRFSM